MRFFSCFFNVHTSQPYVATGLTNAPISRDLALLMADFVLSYFDQFRHSRHPMASLDLSSLVQFASFSSLYNPNTQSISLTLIFSSTHRSRVDPLCGSLFSSLKHLLPC